MDTYPITEAFLSVQGEGVHMGRRAFFIRTYGCNVKCPWCDSKNAWSGGEFGTYSARNLASVALSSRAEICVITGGEPLLHDLLPLVKLLHARKMAVHIETSATLSIPETDTVKFDWVTASPKLFKAPLDASLARADELKFVVGDISQMSEYMRFVPAATNAKAVWLHPEYSRIRDRHLLREICEFVEEHGDPYRAGWQVHKNYAVR